MQPGLRLQALFVVTLQQAPASCVVVDYADYCFACIVDQFLIAQSFGEQLQDLIELNTSFLQTALVEGVAFDQVLFECARVAQFRDCVARLELTR